MEKFTVKISYYSRKNETKKVESTDNVTALIHVFNGLSLEDKNNVKSVQIEVVGS